MDTKLGNAKQARRLARLFEKWQRACESQDAVQMASIKRAIEEAMAAEGKISD